MSKKIIASAVLAAALFAGTSVTAANAAPVAAVSAAKATVTAAQKKAVAAAVAEADANGYTAVLVTGYKKASAASKALAAYAASYIAKKGSSLEVRTAAGDDFDGLVVVAASSETAGAYSINGVGILDGGTYQAPAGTTSVAVSANFKSAYVTYAVDGNTGLVQGDNIVSITVTAENGDQDVYNFDVFVAAAK